MASDYTTNYNLDKYVGTDKPNLRDQYNSAMDKIDAQLHKQSNDLVVVSTSAANATSVAQKAQTAAEDAQKSADAAQTTANQGVSDAANAKTRADDAYTLATQKAPISHAASTILYGAATTSLFGHTRLSDTATDVRAADMGVAATPYMVQAVADAVRNEIRDYFDVSAHVSTYSSNGASVSLLQNSAGTVFKFYGTFRRGSNTSYPNTAVPGFVKNGLQMYGLKTGLTLLTKPTAAYEVITGGRNFHGANSYDYYVQGGMSSFAVGTDGVIYIALLASSDNPYTISSGSYKSQDFPACIYFNADFGDTTD